ncbi:hypothetical protein [Halobacillus salinus]|uniref:hypothetical protein n=1 Tax=Halobacillus salinus TaxID=192814 RepID=UPI0009A7D8E8|nr:hypothetical protein [Halobacillus salinus]
MARRKRNWVALGTAGAVGAAAMYGVSRMKQQGKLHRAGEAIQSAHQQSMENVQHALENNEL